MTIRIKKCFFCERRLILGYYRANPRAADGYWAWCKQCEKKYAFYQAVGESEGTSKHIISFSGGKDSTALLLRMIEEKMQIDAVCYFNCGTFEFPQMENHINKIKIVLAREKIEYIEVKPKIDFFDMAYLYKPEKKKEFNGWPSPHLRWCTYMKMNAIKQRLRCFKPVTQYIGFAADEEDRVLKAAAQNTKNNRHGFNNRYMLVEWGMSEKDCLDYCFSRGYDWDGLYNHFDRVSCWCCPLQGHKDMIKLYKYYPELWSRLKFMDEQISAVTGKHFKNEAGIFDRIEQKAAI